MLRRVARWMLALLALPILALAQDSTVTPAPVPPSYGIQWFTHWTLADGGTAYVNLVGAAYASGDLLYTVDVNQGVIQLDAASGTVLEVFPNDDLTAPTDVAVDGDGNVYIADIACRCIQVLSRAGQWQEEIGGFGQTAPLDIAASPDGILYATDQNDSGVVVRIVRGADEQAISFGIPVAAQPRLTADQDGRVLAVTVDGAVLMLQDSHFAPLFALTTISSVVNDAAYSNDDLVVVTAEGVVVVNSSGQEMTRLGRIVATAPLAGEVVNPTGVAVSPNGTIYWVDSDGQFGAITALSAQAASAETAILALDVPAHGTLSESRPQQRWIFNGIAGQQVTISAVDAVHDSGLDVALRLLAPDGSEEAYNDDQTGDDLYGLYDAQIPNHTFAASGAYTLVVEWVQGEGTYSLGISAARPFELSADGVTYLQGQISDVFATQRWTLTGRAGQVFTITMQAAPDSALDPLLRLLRPDGRVVARNDDALDTALGVNAQLSQVALPADGTYVIEASRYEGEGAYTLVIVATM